MTPEQKKALKIFLSYIETLNTNANSRVYNAWEVLRELIEEK